MFTLESSYLDMTLREPLRVTQLIKAYRMWCGVAVTSDQTWGSGRSQRSETAMRHRCPFDRVWAGAAARRGVGGGGACGGGTHVI